MSLIFLSRLFAVKSRCSHVVVFVEGVLVVVLWWCGRRSEYGVMVEWRRDWRWFDGGVVE